MESFSSSGSRVLSDSFASQVVVQVLVAVVSVGFIVHLSGKQRGDCLHRLLPGKVVVKVAMDKRIFLQVCQRFFEVVHGVHHKMVAGGFNAYRLVAGLPQGHVREKIHKSLEHAHMVLRFIVGVPYHRNILVFQAAFIIRVAHLIAAGQVAESQSEVVPPAQFVMHLLAEHLSDVGIYHAGTEV